jgi:hypothetical protein
MSVRAELEKLLEVINGAALLAIEEYEKNGNGVPSLDSVEKQPLDDAFDSLALRKAIRLLEGACGQLCATLAPPAHTVINVRVIFHTRFPSDNHNRQSGRKITTGHACVS